MATLTVPMAIRQYIRATPAATLIVHSRVMNEMQHIVQGFHDHNHNPPAPPLVKFRGKKPAPQSEPAPHIKIDVTPAEVVKELWVQVQADRCEFMPGVDLRDFDEKMTAYVQEQFQHVWSVGGSNAISADLVLWEGLYDGKLTARMVFIGAILEEGEVPADTDEDTITKVLKETGATNLHCHQDVDRGSYNTRYMRYTYNNVEWKWEAVTFMKKLWAEGVYLKMAEEAIRNTPPDP